MSGLARVPLLLEGSALTDEELAWALNTTQASVRSWIAGAHTPPPRVQARLDRLAAAPSYPYTVVDDENPRGPIFLPDGVWTPAFAPRGQVRLPHHLNWSGTAQDRLRDASTLRGRMLLYQQVITEGTAADIVTWVDPVELAATIDDRIWSRRHQDQWRHKLLRDGLLCR